jgi:phosphate uptake regulator
MATVLEQMLAEARRALSLRKLEHVASVLRSDAEIDRLRNLVLMRHLEGGQGSATPDSIHVVFMAQSLERGGDHAKNLAEEVAHLVSGHSVRHTMHNQDKNLEQMYLERLREEQMPPASGL